MDEKEYRSALESVNPNRCVFEKAVFTTLCECQYARRFVVADRQGIDCRSILKHRHCGELASVIREMSKFLMQQVHTEQGLPHAKELQLQIGGLLGVQESIFPGINTDRVKDVSSTVELARSRFDDLKTLPADIVVQRIAGFSLRRCRS